MKKVMKKLFDTPFLNSINVQLIILNIVLIVVPLIVISLLSQKQYTESMSNAAIRNSEHRIKQLNKTIDAYMEDIVTLSMLPMYDTDFCSSLIESNKAENDGKYNQELDTRLRNFLFTLNYLRSETETVYLYNNKKMVFYNAKSNWTTSGSWRTDVLSQGTRFKTSEWYRQAKEANGKSIIVNQKEGEQEVRVQNEVFSIAKILKYLNTGEEIGAILIDVNVDRLYDLCTEAMQEDYENLIIIDPYGEVMLEIGNQDECRLMKQYSDTIEENVGFQTAELSKDKSYLLNYHTGQYSDLKIVWSVPLAKILRDINAIHWLMQIMMMCIGVFIIILIVFLSSAVFRPLKALIKKIQKIENGNLNVQFNAGSKNEIGVLADSFNRMVQQLKKMIEEVYIAKLKQKDAQIRALQYQINPHFLYNTLESIHMTAELNRDLATGESIANLAQLFRYAVEDARKPVTVRKELENIIHYINIMKMRMGNELSFIVSCSEDLYSYKLPKFTLQPLIENAVTHGLKYKKEGTKSIIVTVSKQNNDLLIVVVDNGVGMDRRKKEQLERRIESDDMMNDNEDIASTAIGAVNVHQRIRLIYGEGYGLKYTSSPETGTQVVITIPAEEEPKE